MIYACAQELNRNSKRRKNGNEREDARETVGSTTISTSRLTSTLFPPKLPGNQNPNAGMMPSSSSDEEDEESDGPARQNPRAGQMPSSSSEDEDEGGEEEGGAEKTKKRNGSDKGKAPAAAAAAPAAPAEPYKSSKQRKAEAAAAAINLERLALVRRKREEDRAKRIAEEGWDRFAPLTETNKPPGTGELPKDHPSLQRKKTEEEEDGGDDDDDDDEDEEEHSDSDSD